jgi:hypothetical protein
MVFAFQTVNGWLVKFLPLLRRGVSLTGPFEAVLLRPSLPNWLSYRRRSVILVTE